VARLDNTIADLAREFVLVRIVNARGVNLSVFDFDYDLSWAAFFMNADETIYGRFGGRDASSPDKYLTGAGLRYAMVQALAAHRRPPATPPPAAPRLSQTVEEYPAGKRLKGNSCIHCHQVHDFRREAEQTAGTWHKEQVWVYPLPENLGFSVDSEQGDRLAKVTTGTAAARAGLRTGDVLTRVQSRPVASFADVQYALHLAPAKGQLAVTFERKGEAKSANLALEEGWRQTDLSWRASIRSLGPSPSVRGEDVTAEEKSALGIAPRSLAFRQGNFVAAAAEQAGLRRGDIIIGVDGTTPEMTMGQFLVHIRLRYQAGDRITYTILRAGKRLDIPLNLPEPVRR
jgi:hypothetical protein